LIAKLQCVDENYLRTKNKGGRLADRLPGVVVVAKDDTRDVESPDVFVRWGSQLEGNDGFRSHDNFLA